jgi:hypothetical protein
VRKVFSSLSFLMNNYLNGSFSLSRIQMPADNISS